ncbi:ABC transporter ATP-binding protein [Bacteroidales bacterium OttesenSCG-928-K03]|nr:ABC transporter ATP-binding protein [Bacteroidales bacterium OttesenSCG-928-L14]MDL2242667.1 ABC transporter ATP-binding protein [Bacteroidales bacterium OttesenSCG-928-K03]
MNTSTNNILSLEGFSLSFLSDNVYNEVVENVSFSVQKGKTLGIVGESGSGKTVTTLSLIKLLDYPPARINKGKAEFNIDGESVDLLSLPEKKLVKYRGKKISCIFQTPMTSLNPSMRCGHQITEILKIHLGLSNKEAYEETIRLFEEVRLPRPEDIFKSYPHEISGGQRQRVMIAMAVACRPDILIADEPTTALDVSVQKSIIELLKDLQEKYKMSIIFISHNLGIVRAIADYVIVMNQGKIVETNTAENIFNNPQQAYTMGLMACKPPLNFNLKYLPTVEEVERLKENNPNFSVNEYINSLKIEKDFHIDKDKEKLLLSVQNLKVYYPQKVNIFGKAKTFVKAVDDISFDIYDGETLSLLGESGCGKSTTARVIAGLLYPTAGQIFFNNENISTLRGKKRIRISKEIQMVFQDPYSSLNPKKTIGQALMEPLRVHKILDNEKQRREKVDYLLDVVGMKTSDFDKYPHEFSGGQRQRVCIARALTLNPKLLVCDEPVSSLDVSVQAKVLNLLQKLKEDFNLSMLFISHDIAVVRHVSDRISVMKEGAIIESENPLNLISNPQNAYTKNLINSSL